ncbi:ShlB/FhaC/HecB family hemolysin secretion/activation protein [Klebsiella variicola subsp. variicola]|nr:ShlB/FhaC/HecB family hemolysin secretion/activation protein [Klebsiella variicola subsp. variicola]
MTPPATNLQAPRLGAQFSPDKLASDNKFNIGSRWSVRGFDGENSLSGNQGWYWRNDFIWDLPTHERQFYLGADVGRLIGADLYQRQKSFPAPSAACADNYGQRNTICLLAPRSVNRIRFIATP